MPNCTLSENQTGCCVVPLLQFAQCQQELPQENKNLQLHTYTQGATAPETGRHCKIKIWSLTLSSPKLMNYILSIILYDGRTRH